MPFQRASVLCAMIRRKHRSPVLCTVTCWCNVHGAKRLRHTVTAVSDQDGPQPRRSAAARRRTVNDDGVLQLVITTRNTRWHQAVDVHCPIVPPPRMLTMLMPLLVHQTIALSTSSRRALNSPLDLIRFMNISNPFSDKQSRYH